MPDRKITLTLRYSFEAVIDEASLKARTGKTNPSATEMDAAFQQWKSEYLENTKRSFKTGNSLAPDSKIEIQVT